MDEEETESIFRKTTLFDKVYTNGAPTKFQQFQQIFSSKLLSVQQMQSKQNDHVYSDGNMAQINFLNDTLLIFGIVLMRAHSHGHLYISFSIRVIECYNFKIIYVLNGLHCSCSTVCVSQNNLE